MNHLIRTCKCHWLGESYLHWGRAADREPFAAPGTAPRYAPDAPVVSRHMRLDWHFDLDRQRLWGKTTHELAVRAPKASEVRLNAVDLEIEAVALNGKSVPFDYSGEVLTVPFPGGTRRGALLRLAIAHAVERPRAGLYFTNPDRAYPKRFQTAWSQGQDEDSRHYFPCLDAPNFKQTTEALLYVPRGLFALSNGDLLEHRRRATPEEDLWHYRFGVPYSTYLFSVVVGKFAAHRERAGDVEVRWFAEPGRETEARNAFGATGEILRFLAGFTGHPYPCAQYTQIAVPDFVFGGMENFTVTTQTDLTLHDDRAHLDFSSDDLVTHEAAHTWFGNLVTARSWAHAWLHESFATYMEALYKREKLGADEYDLAVLLDAEAYFREDALYRRPIVTHRYEFPIDLFDAHLYPGGAVRLRHLHALLGEAAFREVLRRFLEEHRLGLAETVDLARTVEAIAGENYDWWFDQWILGAGFPNLEVKYAWQADKKLVELRIKQKEPLASTDGNNGKTWFRLPLTVLLQAEHTSRHVSIVAEGEESRFLIPQTVQPEMVLLDPDFECPAMAVEFEKPVEMWLAQLNKAPKAMQRIQAAAALAEKPSSKAVAALAERLRQEPFWGAQQRIARALGRIGGEAARDALIGAMKLPHPKARRAVLEALASFRDDSRATAALERKAGRGDASYLVEAEAARTLGRLHTPGALPMLKRMLRRRSHVESIRSACFDALGELGDREGFVLAAEGARYGAPQDSRPAAIQALARLALLHPELRKPARDLLEGIAQHRDNPAATFRGKLAALRALERLGDLEALPALRRVQENEADGRIVRLARLTATHLRKQAEKPKELQALRDDLDKVFRENKSLRERLDGLERASPSGKRKRAAPKRRPRAQSRPRG
jgi:aminopeptidase N